MEIEYANQRIKKSLDPRRLVASHGKVRAELLRRLMGKLEAAESMADINEFTRVRLHWLSENLDGFMSMDLDHPYRLLATALNGQKDSWSSITRICIHCIKNTHD